MPAVLTQLADAVVEQINEADPGTFPLEFEATRCWLPQFTLEALQAGIKLQLRPATWTAQRFSRRTLQRQYVLELAIAAKLDDVADPRQTDPIQELAEQLGDYLFDHPHALSAQYTLMSVEPADPWPDEEMLKSNNLFLAGLRLTYQAIL